MEYKLEDLIDIPFFQDLLDKLNEIYPFPSAILDVDGKILTATAWQPLCTQFHRKNPESELECMASDKYILDHIAEANPAISYRCPHGMIDNAIPIIIGGRHLANFFTGQFFLEPPDMEFFKQQARKYKFNESAYLQAVQQAPVWNKDQLSKYLAFIKPFVHSIAEMGLIRLQELENKKILEDSQLRFHDLFESAPVMYVIAHDVNGLPVITDCNQQFLDTLGYKREDVLGKELTDFYTADSKNEFLQKGGYQRATSGNSLVEERNLVSRNGTLLTCLVWSRPEKGPGGNVTGLRSTYMDISHRKETEQALQESELQYSATIDALDDGIHVVDKDLNIILCNAAMSKWVQDLGYSGILVGKPLFRAFPFLPESIRDEYQRVFHNRKTLITEEISQAGGLEIQTETRKIPVIENGRVERIVTVIRDISERKRADQQLKGSESELKKAQSYAHVGSWVWDIKTGHLKWSDEMYNIFGISRDGFSGKLEEVVASAIHPDDREAVERSNLSVMNEGKPIPLEYRILRPDGSERVVWAEAGELERDEHGGPCLLRGIVMDITERKQAEEEKGKLLRILEASLNEIYVFTTNTFKFNYVNESALHNLGYTYEEIKQLAPYDLKPEYTEDTFRAITVPLLNGEKEALVFQTIHRRKDGSTYPVEVHLQVVQSGLEKVFLAVIYDITERKKAEETLRFEEEKFRTFVEQTSAIIYIVDAGREARVDYISPQIEKVLGFTPEEWIAQPGLWESLLHPDDRERVLAENDHADLTGEPFKSEYRIFTKDGRVVWFYDESSKVLGDNEQVFLSLGIETDITERKQAEEALRASEERFRALIEHNHDAITLLAADGTVLYDSPSIENVLGYGPTERIGHKVFEFVYGDDLDRMKQGFVKFALQMGAVASSNLRFLHKNGSLRDIEGIRTNLLQDPAVRAIVVNYRDMTDRNQAEKRLKESESKFRLIIDASPVPYALNDDQQNITYLNQAFVNTFGYTLEDIPTLAEWWPKAYPEAEYRQWVATTWQEHLDQAKRTGSPFEPLELNIRCKDGSLRTALVSATPIAEALSGVHLVILYDITERKLARQLLENERNFATQVMNSMGQGLTVTDELGRFEFINPAYAHMTGYDPAELIGKLPEEINWPEDMVVLNEAGALRTQGKSTTYEIRLKHKDGHPVNVMITGVPRWSAGQVRGAIAVITDLTERKQVEVALQRKNQFLMALQNTTLELISQLDLRTLLENIVKRACALMGTSSGVLNLVDEKTDQLIPQVGVGTLKETLVFTVQKGEGISGKVWQTGEMLVIEDYDQWPGRLSGFSFGSIGSVVGVPLKLEGDVLGVLLVASEFGSQLPLEPETIDILNQFARLATVAVQNARLFAKLQVELSERTIIEDEIRKRVGELDILQKTVLDITASQNLPGLLESIVKRACLLVGAPGGGLYLNDQEKKEVTCMVSYNTPSDYSGVVIKHGEGVAGWIAQNGKPLNIPDYRNWPGRAPAFEQEKPFTAVLGVPLFWGDRVTGVIDMVKFEEGISFKQVDQEMLNLFAGHAAIAIENSRLLKEAISRSEEVRQLSIRLEEAEENERRRIARELHDQVGQSLSALSINLNIVHSQMPEYLPGFKRRLEDSLMLIDQTTDNIRSLMSELRPAVLDDYGLKAALDWAATTIIRRTELKVLVEGECKRFEPRVEIALFRIAQEVLSNVSRHAQARNVNIRLIQIGPDFTMSIADDGIGLGTTLPLVSKTGGMGMRLMRERADAIGASLQIETGHRQGTIITVKYHDQDPAGG